MFTPSGTGGLDCAAAAERWDHRVRATSRDAWPGATFLAGRSASSVRGETVAASHTRNSRSAWSETGAKLNRTVAGFRPWAAHRLPYARRTVAIGSASKRTCVEKTPHPARVLSTRR